MALEIGSAGDVRNHILTRMECRMGTISQTYTNNSPKYDGLGGNKAMPWDHENKAVMKGFHMVEKLNEKSLNSIFHWILKWNKTHTEQYIPE